MIRLLWLRARLAYYRRASHEITPTHPDVPRVTRRLNHLEHEWRSACVDFHRWRHNSPTLSAVKNWL